MSNNTTSNTPHEGEEITQRESFVFYRSFFESIVLLPKTEQLQLYNAICDYALNEKEHELKPRVMGSWVLIYPHLKSNRQKYLNGCKGGAQKGNQNARKQNKNEQKRAYENVNDNVNENDNVDDDVDVASDGRNKNNTPLLVDINDYIREMGLGVDGTEFFDYYASNGWLLGREPMSDWRAALRNWERRSTKQNTSQSTVKIPV